MPIPQQSNEYVRMSARERVQHTLQEWIVDGTLKPNERLNDSELAQHFSVSRTPVREALQALSEQRLVQIVPACGTFVSPIDSDDLSCVYSLIGDLHALALAYAMPRVTAQNIRELTQLNETFYRTTRSGSADERSMADFEFHRYICVLAGNPYLTSFSDQLSVHARRGEVYYFSDDTLSLTSFHHHERIIEALENRDLATAQEYMRKNWQLSTDLLRNTPNL